MSKDDVIEMQGTKSTDLKIKRLLKLKGIVKEG